MDFSVEQELQATAESLKRTRNKFERTKDQLEIAELKLSACKAELNQSHADLVLCRREILRLRDELKESREQFDFQQGCILAYQDHLSIMRTHRWKFLSDILSVRAAMALSLDKVRELEHKFDCLNHQE
ncbi:uncharacterized protein LOC132193910 [Neocloeon triangulifer]|uniref:uncharacterized protein LOC132193910 n=1 Tax=Neocloeon triangulifer TaxID=2078957 RepID=UPI00286F0D58|nr:uncharacterized protein LOC132193910 [Neocloeon triangulifer]